MKYTTTLIILLGIVAVCWAGREYKIYKDQLCVQSYSAYYWVNNYSNSSIIMFAN